MGDIYADGGTVSYPTTLDTATTQVDATPALTFGTTVAAASKINNIATALINIETELGTLPKGTSATVTERLAGIRSLSGATADTIQVSGSQVGLGTATLTAVKVVVGGTITASGTVGFVHEVRGTITAAANADIMAAGNFGLTTFAKGTLTGLTAHGIRMVPSNLGVTGTGTIDNCAGIYIADNPTIGTNNYAIWLDAGTFRWDDPIALGGGVAPTLGTIGGTGPAVAAQNQWLRVNINGTVNFIPVWQ